MGLAFSTTRYGKAPAEQGVGDAELAPAGD